MFVRSVVAGWCWRGVAVSAVLGGVAGCSGGGQAARGEGVDNARARSADAGETSEASAEAAPAASETLPPGVAHLRMSGCSQHDYFAMVSVGGDTFSLLLDSGSTMMAVANASCADCGDADRYHAATGRDTGVAVSSKYADGSGWSGSVFSDQVAMGAAGARVTKQVPVKFAAIKDADAFFTGGSCQVRKDLQFDGILGLGPDTLLRKNTTSLLTSLAASHTLAADVFSLRTCNIGGDIWFGGYDPGVLTGELRYTQLVTAGQAAHYYGIDIDGLQLGGRALPLTASEIGPMVVDNGTSGLLLSEPAYDAVVDTLMHDRAFLRHFPAEMFHGGSCPQSARGAGPAEIDAALPKLTFVLPDSEGGTFAVELTATGSYLQPLLADDGDVYYCPQIAPAAEGVPPLYGNAAMRQHVVVFDREASRVGFATHEGCPDALPAASVQ